MDLEKLAHDKTLTVLANEDAEVGELVLDSQVAFRYPRSAVGVGHGCRYAGIACGP
jgi:hypothetical protein